MSTTITVLKEDNECHLFADVFRESHHSCRSANPVTYHTRPVFGNKTTIGNPMLVIPLEDAKKMAKEILEL